MQKNVKLKRELYNRKKLLLKMYTLGLIASCMMVNAKTTANANAKAGISKTIENALKEQELSLYAGVTADVIKMLKDSSEYEKKLHVEQNTEINNNISIINEKEQLYKSKEEIYYRENTRKLN